MTPISQPLIMILVLALFLLFWCSQFVFMMLLPDSSFPGKYDKLIWAAVVVLLFPLAPFAFKLWRIASREANSLPPTR